MNDANEAPCTCHSCPGTGCACGCQGSQGQTACACGDACRCGAACDCARS